MGFAYALPMKNIEVELNGKEKVTIPSYLRFNFEKYFKIGGIYRKGATMHGMKVESAEDMGELYKSVYKVNYQTIRQTSLDLVRPSVVVYIQGEMKITDPTGQLHKYGEVDFFCTEYNDYLLLSADPVEDIEKFPPRRRIG